MYITKTTVDVSAIKAQRDRAVAATGLMGSYTQQVIAPAIQARVDATYAPYPQLAIHPFEFATPRSRRWYRAQVRAGNIRTDGTRYIRNGDLGKAWMVLFDRRQTEGFLTVKNTASMAIYVFGNRQVAGHATTGWGQNFAQANQEVSGLATYLLAQGWYLILSGKWTG